MLMLINERLKWARETAGLSLGQAQKLVGPHASGVYACTIQMAEYPGSLVPTDLLLELAKIYNASAEWLSLGILNSINKTKVLKHLCRMSVDDRQKVIDILERSWVPPTGR